MTYPALLVDVTIFVLSLWVGFEVISKVPATLHTPLMSAANSIHGIVLAGAMLIAVTAHNTVGYIILFLAAAFASANVAGGYAVTGRMLKMFRRRPSIPPPGAAAASAGGVGAGGLDVGAIGPVELSKGNGSSRAAANGSRQPGQQKGGPA
jgi:H+-translocating NAD(P) transhydrogenase subunit alpha